MTLKIKLTEANRPTRLSAFDPISSKKKKDKSGVIGMPYPIGVSSTYGTEPEEREEDEDDDDDKKEAAASSESGNDTLIEEMPRKKAYVDESKTMIDTMTADETADETDTDYDTTTCTEDKMEEGSCAPNLASVSILSPNRNLLWPEFEIENSRTESAFGYFMVPIITLGSWSHPYYGDVIFEQADFDLVISNFQIRAAAYEPALYVGHGSPFDGGGRPAAGFLEVLVQNEDVLWGIFAAVDETVYMDVKKGKYRYSSAELTTDTVHRQSGDELGLVLTGCALTNEPFLTNMPPVRVFNNPQANLTAQTSTRPPLSIAYQLNHNSCVKDNPKLQSGVGESKPVQLAIEAPATPATPATPAVIPAAIELAAPTHSNQDLALSTTLAAMSAELAALKAEFSNVKAEVQVLSVENDTLKSARSNDLKEKRFSIIKEAALSAGAKQAFTTALSSPGMDDATADALVAQAQELSTAEATTYLTQHGNVGATELSVPNPATAAPKQEFGYSKFLEGRAARMPK